MPRLLALLLPLSLVVPGGSPPPLASAADWPQILGPNRDGHSAETKLNWDWPKDGPPIAWTKEIGSGWASPVIVDGKLFLFHRVGDDESLLCLDPATGKEHWTSKYATKYRDDFGFDDGPRATPTIADGKIFTLGPNGNLRAVDAATSKEIWHLNLLETYKASKGYFGVACSPILVGGKLLVNVGGKGAGVVAFDPANGKELWKATDDAASYSSPTVAEIDGKPAAVFLTRFRAARLRPGQRQGALRTGVEAADQRERAGGNSARVEGRNLPHRVVFHRRCARESEGRRVE